MGAKKLGRPFTGDKPLSKDLKVKVDEDTYLCLSKIALDNQTSIADIVRQSINDFLNKKEK